MKCNIIAEGVVTVAKEIGLAVPLVVRLEGTNVELGKEILNASGLKHRCSWIQWLTVHKKLWD